VTPSSDDPHVTTGDDLDERAADGLLAGRPVPDEPALTAFVEELRSLASEPAPLPSAALAAVLEGGLAGDALAPPIATPVTRAPWWRPRGWALPLQLGLAGAACVGLVLVAAATDRLPAPAQTAVAEVVETFTPLHLPHGEHRRVGRPVVVVPTPSPQPTVAAETPVAQPTRRPVAPAGTTAHEDGQEAGTASDGGSTNGTGASEQPATTAGSGSDDREAPQPSPTPVVQEPDGQSSDAPDGDSPPQ
jgi:hypothetical protein